MMVNKNIIGLLLLFLCFSFISCFKEDIPIKPVEKIRSTSIKNTIYKVQSFYSLSKDSVLLTSPNEAWDLAFESRPEGWHIRINYSSLKGIYHTSSRNFNETSFSIQSAGWIYDASSGNPDSTAIGNWKNFGTEGPEVMLIGTYDGSTYIPFKKLIFHSFSDTTFRFTFANLDNSGLVDQVIRKDTSFNFVYFSLTKAAIVRVEPPKRNWDLLFTQYNTTLFDSKGTAVYNYPVRGVYLNPYMVTATLDTVHTYAGITSATIGSYSFSSIQDYIGYNWKEVSVNQSANTATYAVRKNYVYVIKNTEGQLYKLKFLSFVNDSLKVGYPTFQTSGIAN